jgi:hypothetical protein
VSVTSFSVQCRIVSVICAFFITTVTAPGVIGWLSEAMDGLGS